MLSAPIGRIGNARVELEVGRIVGGAFPADLRDVAVGSRTIALRKEKRRVVGIGEGERVGADDGETAAKAECRPRTGDARVGNRGVLQDERTESVGLVRRLFQRPSVDVYRDIILGVELPHRITGPEMQRRAGMDGKRVWVALRTEHATSVGGVGRISGIHKERPLHNVHVASICGVVCMRRAIAEFESTCARLAETGSNARIGRVAGRPDDRHANDDVGVVVPRHVRYIDHALPLRPELADRHSRTVVDS